MPNEGDIGTLNNTATHSKRTEIVTPRNKSPVCVRDSFQRSREQFDDIRFRTSSEFETRTV